MSIHTIRSYRDTVVLWLQFAARDTRRRLESLGVADLTAERVERFLMHLEAERGNGIGTRNARLAALHTFVRHLGAKHPEQLGVVQSILTIPFKRGAPEVPIEYPESADIQALMNHIDRRTPTGQRDYALFALMFNTGRGSKRSSPSAARSAARASRANTPARQRRQDPPLSLWPRTARLLRDLLAGQAPGTLIRQRPPCFVTATADRSPDSACVTCCASTCRTIDPRRRADASIHTPCGTPRQFIY